VSVAPVPVAATADRPTKPALVPPARPATSKLRSTVPLTTTMARPATETETDTPAAPTRPDKPFDFDQLQSAWVSFARLRQQQNDSASEQLILNRDIELDGLTIRLTLDNTLQVGILNDFKAELVTYLRNQLQNSQVQVEHEVRLQEVKKMIYSPQDKYNYLAEKNPALHDLRQALNLEVDY
jgi:DNA polymerase-3 subunit gamma/tau